MADYRYLKHCCPGQIICCPNIPKRQAALILKRPEKQEIPQVSGEPTNFPYTLINFNNATTEINIGNIVYDSNSKQFIIPDDGFYSIVVYLTWESKDEGEREMWINKYDETHQITPTPIAADTRSATNTVVPMRITLSALDFFKAGDRLSISVWHSLNEPLNIKVLEDGLATLNDNNSISIKKL